MPLTPVYTWTETESSVRITVDGVPIKDQSQLFCSDRLVKLNAPPYLLLLDLKAPVDDDQSTATVLHGRKVVFQLAKAEPGLWGTLTAEGEKSTIKQQRDESVQRAHEKQVAAQQQRLARKQQEERAAVDRHIAHDRAQPPVAVSFTQLSTPHLPAREQREVELRDIKRLAKADSLDVSERQPAFLKDKGDALAAQGNFRGAINAYTRALELQPKQPSLWCKQRRQQQQQQ
ncbi:hypothetical protein OEZ86_009265 [Tetradesmus obliquus]|nr:hypothetical protein OEZ86_009265 [Tetradesmus obliquus]